MAGLCFLSLTPPDVGAYLLADAALTAQNSESASCSKLTWELPARWQRGKGALLRAGTTVLTQ